MADYKMLIDFIKPVKSKNTSVLYFSSVFIQTFKVGRKVSLCRFCINIATVIFYLLIY